MKKQLVNEDIKKMQSLIGYDRSKTLTENKEVNDSPQLLNEVDIQTLAKEAGWGALASAGIGAVGTAVGGATGAALGSVGGPAGIVIGAALGAGVSYLYDVFGPKNQNPVCDEILSPGTYDTVVEGFEEIAKAAGLDKD